MEITLSKCHYHGHMPGLEVTGATKEFHEFIMDKVFTNRINDPWYVRRHELKVNPFFQGGSVFSPINAWLFIEFWTKDFANVFNFVDELMQAWTKVNTAKVLTKFILVK